MHLRPTILAALAALATLAACDGTACTEEARASVTVTVVDAKDAPITDATVTYTVDGGAEESAECFGAQQGVCDSYVAGYEVAGDFVIKAVSADGTMMAEAMVTVTADECHVMGQTVELVLK